MNTGLKFSFILHILILSMFYLTLPYTQKLLTVEKIITVDIVKTSKITNLQNSKISHIQKTHPLQSKATLKQIKQITSENTKSEEINTTKLEDKNKSLLSTPIKNEITFNNNKKNINNKSSANNSKNEKDLDNLLKDLSKTSLSSQNKSKELKNSTRNKASSSKEFQDDLPLTLSEKDNIKIQIEKNFISPIILDFNPGEVIIKLKMDMNINGTIQRVITLKDSTYPKKHTKAFFSLKNNLIRAAHIASPLQNLPKDKYNGSQGWKEIELIFDAYYLMNS